MNVDWRAVRVSMLKRSHRHYGKDPKTNLSTRPSKENIMYRDNKSKEKVSKSD
jgi:hypothetical protein